VQIEGGSVEGERDERVRRRRRWERGRVRETGAESVL